MSLLSTRGGRKGPIICFVALLFLFALYQLGIICAPSKDENSSVMVAREVSKSFCFAHAQKTGRVRIGYQIFFPSNTN